MNVEPVVPVSAIEHFVYCPRQCALIHCDVSPGFTPRPSLSTDGARGAEHPGPVSPGFTPRPSLSDGASDVGHGSDVGVSPGVTPRPSLSGV